MQIEDRGLIFDARPAAAGQRANAFTSLRRLADGTLIAGFQSGPSKHGPTSTVRLSHSVDGGQTWSAPLAPFSTTLEGIPGSLSSGDLVEVSPGRLLIFATWFDRSDPDRPLFDPVTEGLLHSRQLVAESTDGGSTWGDWRVLPTPGLTGCAATGPVVQWPDGTIAFAFESFREFDDPVPKPHAAWLAVSHDGGESFSEFHQVAQHPEHAVYYWDQRICPGRNPGEYDALFWTHDLKAKRDLAVHFKSGHLQNSGGNRDIHSTGVAGQIAAPQRLADGRLVAFVVDREQPGTLKLWCSSDDGQTWPAAEALSIYSHDEQARLSQGLTNIDFKQYWEDMAKWTFGHPAVCLLDRNHLLLAFYAGTPDALSVHWVRVATG